MLKLLNRNKTRGYKSLDVHAIATMSRGRNAHPFIMRTLLVLVSCSIVPHTHGQIVNGVCLDMTTFMVTGVNAGACQRNETANSEVISASGFCDDSNLNGRCLTHDDIVLLWDDFLPDFAQGMSAVVDPPFTLTRCLIMQS